MFNVDFVFPYVNPNDKTWQRQYKYCTGQSYEEEARFRDFSLIKYIFRSIDVYAPWINRVVLLVSSMTQVPDFLKKDYYKLQIVTHEEFIPEEYLPTFNSNTIEMFLPNLKLSEHFIYSNDDFLFINPTEVTDFFSKAGVPYIYVTPKNNNVKENTFAACCKRSFDVVQDKINRRLNLDTEYRYLRQLHSSASPRLLSDCKLCFENLNTEILNSLTMFRDFNVNLNQYMYAYHTLLQGLANPVTSSKMGIYTEAEKGEDHIIDSIVNGPTKMLCVNDTKSMTPSIMAKVMSMMEQKFPDKSSFEL